MNHGSVLKKVQRVMKSNQEARLKAQIDMNRNKKKCKNIFWKRIFQVNE